MTWTRIEGSGVSADLTPGLSARVADPLWMLARQWQVGELTGEDAASPLLLGAEIHHQPLGEFRAGKGGAEAVDRDGGALEARAECEDVYTGPSRLRIAAELGAHLLRLIGAKPVDPQLATRLRAAYPLDLTSDEPGPDDVRDPRGDLELELLARHSLDALALADDLRAIRDGGGTGGKGSGDRSVDPGLGDVADPDSLAARFLADTDTLVHRPDRGPPAWDVERLEYRFDVAAPAFAGGTVLAATGYPGGHLDWYGLDVAVTPDPPLGREAPRRTVRSTAVPLQYPGMPANRFWEFEDGAVSWGGLDGGPTDLARYLVGSYAMLFGDDWFLLGADLPRGSLAQVRSVSVVDSFGATFDVPATAAADHVREGEVRSWRFWELSGDPSPGRGESPLLLLPAALPPHDRGRPVEEVALLRDEVANLAWAVERVVEARSGRRVVRSGGSRSEVGSAGARTVPQDENASDVWGYDLATPVPANAVPLVPVRLSETDPSIRFQRGRIATGEVSRGAVGLVLVPDRRLLLHEEEIPGGGVQVTRAWESCRTPDGGVLLWMGRRKRPGRGPKAPGLRHDVVTPAPGSSPEGSGVRP